MTEWKGKNILIAEDNEINYKLVEILISKIKANAIHASDGQVAIDIAKSRPDLDFILMDIMMPNVDGFEAAKEIRKFMPDIPIVAATAYGSEIERDKLEESGFNDIISKPINLDNLTIVFNKYLKP